MHRLLRDLKFLLSKFYVDEIRLEETEQVLLFFSGMSSTSKCLLDRASFSSNICDHPKINYKKDTSVDIVFIRVFIKASQIYLNHFPACASVNKNVFKSKIVDRVMNFLPRRSFQTLYFLA